MKARNWIAILMSVPVVSGAHAQTSQKSSAELKAKVERVQSSSSVKLIPTVGYSAGFYERNEPGSKNYKTDPRSSFNGGLLVEMGRGLMTFQSGLFYLQEGSKLSTSTSNATRRYTAKVDTRVDYLGIPTLLKLNLPSDEKSTRFTMKLGVTPAVLLGLSSRIEETETTASGTSTTNTEFTDTESVRSLNVLGNAGIGLEIPGGSTSTNDIRIEAQYSRGLLPIEKNSDSKTYSQSIMLTIGMGFRL